METTSRERTVSTSTQSAHDAPFCSERKLSIVMDTRHPNAPRRHPDPALDDHHDDPIATNQPRVTVGSRWTDSQGVTWTVIEIRQGRVVIDGGQGLPVTMHRAAFGTTMRPAELPGQLDIFGGER